MFHEKMKGQRIQIKNPSFANHYARQVGRIVTQFGIDRNLCPRCKNTAGKSANDDGDDDDDDGDGDDDADDADGSYRLPVIRTRRSTDALN